MNRLLVHLYIWYGICVTFPSDAPDYEGPTDQGGIWGYWWFNADANGHFLHIWPFWSAGARQTAAAVVPGSQGQGAVRTEPRLYTNIPPRLFARLLPVETQHAASLHAASPPLRPPQPTTIIHTPPVLEDTAAIAYTRQRATLTLANMTIAVHVTNTSAPDELVYVFADHLGSTTLLADDNGDIIPGSAARYLPFGGYRTAPTQTFTDRGYTGQKHNDDLGLIYYNARYYLPGIGRFVSADTIVPDAANPQAFNRYAYVLNNPTRFTDSTGHCIDGLTTAACVLLLAMVGTTASIEFFNRGGLSPWNPRSYPIIAEINGQRARPPSSSDVTGWLIEQMVQAGNSEIVANLRSAWNGSLVEQDAALAVWTSLVRTNAVWDFKLDIVQAGIRFGDDLITLGGHDLNFQVVANIFFGFVGRQIGMSENFLQFGAGVAQSEHGWGHWFSNVKAYPAGFGDQEFDAWAIAFGYYLYELFKNDLSELTEAAFIDALNDYVADNPVPPGP